MRGGAVGRQEEEEERGRDTIVAISGSRSVPLRTSGHHFTVILTGKAL